MNSTARCRGNGLSLLHAAIAALDMVSQCQLVCFGCSGDAMCTAQACGRRAPGDRQCSVATRWERRRARVQSCIELPLTCAPCSSTCQAYRTRAQRWVTRELSALLRTVPESLLVTAIVDATAAAGTSGPPKSNLASSGLDRQVNSDSRPPKRTRWGPPPAPDGHPELAEARSLLTPLIGAGRVRHFLHELRHAYSPSPCAGFLLFTHGVRVGCGPARLCTCSEFSSSPFSMDTYDEVCRYRAVGTPNTATQSASGCHGTRSQERRRADNRSGSQVEPGHSQRVARASPTRRGGAHRRFRAGQHAPSRHAGRAVGVHTTTGS